MTFRRLVALALKVEGVEAVEPRARGRRLSDRLADEGEPSDLLGLDNWAIHVRADLSPRWGAAIDNAERAAALDGRTHAAVVQYRRDADASRHFVLMSLAGFAALLKERES
jgi:hypothetical protein